MEQEEKNCEVNKSIKNGPLSEILVKLANEFTNKAKEEAEKFGVSLDVLVKFLAKQ